MYADYTVYEQCTVSLHIKTFETAECYVLHVRNKRFVIQNYHVRTGSVDKIECSTECMAGLS